jgi:abortive infection bacteriophage resistance protein
VKKATKIDEQIEKLKSRGMVLDLGVAKSQEILLDIGYYRLGFYCFPFEKSYPSLKARTHEYREGSRISDIICLYYLDYNLRHILLKYLNRIEVNFRTTITYWVSNEYVDQNNTWFVDSSIMNERFVASFDNKIYDSIKDRNKVLKEHHLKYPKDSYAPAWKTLEFLTFGAIITIYQNLKNEQLKRKVADVYGIKSFKACFNYVNTVKEIRNACAHGSVLFDFTLPQSICKGPAFSYEKHGKNNLYSSILVIGYLLTKISNNRAEELDKEIKALFSVHKENPAIRSIIENKIGFKYI